MHFIYSELLMNLLSQYNFMQVMQAFLLIFNFHLIFLYVQKKLFVFLSLTLDQQILVLINQHQLKLSFVNSPHQLQVLS